MSRQRSLETLTDILCIVVSPMLVMFLVGSLAFFSIQCFYDGQFFGRLNFATAMFVMAAVLVARIAIEDGREYASAFSLPLGAVTVLSLIQYTGINPLIATGLVLGIWWSTDKLTWDCTVLDEQKDASGEGLMQTIGLDKDEPNEVSEPNSANKEPAVLDAEATTDRDQTESTSLWQRWIKYRRRHHTPGVWVVYFGLAAIPLFGIGQAMLPKESKGAGFLLLCIYVASALALLMITSFLQMRRYLIQRRLPFSEKMAATWLGTGGALIVGLMILCLMLPRPNTGYSIVDAVSEQFEKVSLDEDEKREASRRAVGKEGVADDDVDGQGENDDEEAESESEQGRQARKDAKRGKREGKQGSDGDQESESGESEGEGEQEGDGEQSDDSNEGKEKKGQQSEDDSQQDSESASQATEEQQDGEEQDGDPQDSSSQSPSQPAWNPMQNFSLPPLPKILYILVVAIAVLVGLYFYGRQVLAGIQAFIRDFMAFFRRLFGGRKQEPDDEPEEIAIAVPEQPFKNFKNPFVTGLANKLSPQQLVAYSFEALQAWAYEQQCPREEDQTPLEFAGQIATSDNAVGTHARTLALLYNQAAYAPGTLGSQTVDHVRKLWQALSK